MASRFARYNSLEDLEKDINDLDKTPGWVLAEWYPCTEWMEARDEQTGHITRWPGTFFYARYLQVPVQEKPAGMKAR